MADQPPLTPMILAHMDQEGRIILPSEATHCYHLAGAIVLHGIAIEAVAEKRRVNGLRLVEEGELGDDSATS